MSSNYSSLSLGRVMMHQITRTDPGGDGTRFTVGLTDEPVSMSTANLSFLTTRFVKALSYRALPVVEEPALGTTAPDTVRSFWSGSSNLVDASKALATHLTSVQPTSALPGLLVVAETRLGQDEALLVAKVEHQAAMRIEAQTNEAGHRIFLIEQLRELVFGESAKIYKVAVLSKVASATGMLGGEVVDDQNGNKFARYFLGKFMGMKLREEPAVLTQNYLERMTEAINSSTLSPEERLEVQSALIAQISSNQNSINPVEFVRNHVPGGHQTEISSLAEVRRVPMVPFPKDTSRVVSQIRAIRLDLSNGVHVVAPAQEVGEGKAVQIEKDSDGADKVTITGGRLTKVKGNGGR